MTISRTWRLGLSIATAVVVLALSVVSILVFVEWLKNGPFWGVKPLYAIGIMWIADVFARIGPALIKDEQ